ncbi:MAG: ParB/Srx family N-terminal domain-containing protein [Bdellovibrio sp.]|nr:ParB/Srx family N-terminal domain-containing protein [Bdellovibrio sp.]
MKSLSILDLKPTQIAIGMLEVEYKVKELKRMTKSKLRTEITKNPVEVVRAPNGDYYLVDGHHRTLACWLIGIRKLPVKVSHQFPRKMSFKSFWKKMKNDDWAYPYDATGAGPQDPLYLPPDIRAIGHDPYRSLSWLLRENGGYEDTEKTFLEFRWADFLREHKVLDNDYDVDYKKGLKKALKLCHKKSAEKLPGYNGKKH